MGRRDIYLVFFCYAGIRTRGFVLARKRSSFANSLRSLALFCSARAFLYCRFPCPHRKHKKNRSTIRPPVFNQDYRRTTYLIIFINIWMHKYPVNEHTTSIILSDTAPKKLIAFRSSVAKKIIQNIIIPQLISITMHANTCIILSTT